MPEEVKETKRAERVRKPRKRTQTRRRGHTRLSTKNQVTIPVDAVDKAGWKPGDEFEVKVEDGGRVVLQRSEDVHREWIEKYAGSMPGVFPPGWLEELRSEWD